ncbi:MAG: hypothetical protein QOG25_1313 [Acetobacteraceae bacterium]|nr:hypothetical protein [Acetobacteraceae bacterium]
MSSIASELADVLGTVRRPAGFFVSGTEQMLAPGLEVDGVGPIGLPVPAVQAQQLVAVAERAPYGRGEDTLTDTSVRRTWQIAAGRVRMQSKYWPKTLQTIVARVAEGLGIDDQIDAELYKLLIYDEGSFFVPHRDTEKSPGMFATLVLALPSVSSGGELIVRHKDREARLDLNREEPSDVAFAAFYADCVHEVLPISSGYRLVLVYNLLRRGAGRLPEAPNYDNEVEAVASLLKDWAEEPRPSGEAPAENNEPEPEKLIYPLEHAYTPAELGFGTLKGADAGTAQVVVAAAERAGCDVHLALVSIEESGSAVQTGGYSSYRRSRYDDDEEADDAEFEVDEMFDRSAVAAHWCRPDGEPSSLTEIPVLEGEFSPPVSFEELDPDEEHFQEATGNEGASYERTYLRAALILWPSDRRLAVINQGGLKVTLPFLEDLTQRWSAGGDAALRQQADVLAEHMIGGWQMHQWHRVSGQDRTSAGRFLGTLVRLDDKARLDRFLALMTSRRGFDAADAADIADALRTLPADRAAAIANELIESSAAAAFAACAALLACVAIQDPVIARLAARTMVGALPRDPARGPASPTWLQGPSVQPGFVIDLFTALEHIDATLAAIAADHVLDWPGTYDFDTVLVPAVHTLLDNPQTADRATVQRLRTACLEHLNTRIALPLEPPSDWRRDSKLGCKCDDCRALGRYLNDAGQQIWVFPAAQHRRSHVEQTIRASHCDVGFTTEKRGSPHRLICTKNQASYQRRCVQRENDLTERARLAA